MTAHESADAPSLRLVDESHGEESSEPSGSGSPQPSPSDGEEPGQDDPASPTPSESDQDDPGSEAADDAGGIPVAAQAGMSLGVIGLAAAALIPGRRPPEHLRRPAG